MSNVSPFDREILKRNERSALEQPAQIIYRNKTDSIHAHSKLSAIANLQRMTSWREGNSYMLLR